MKDSILKSIDTIVLKNTSIVDNISTVANSNPNTDNSAWISLWSAIAGGVLVITGQFLVEYFKKKSENKTNISSILSEITRQKEILKHLYRELAMYKTHSSYWWYCTIIADTQIEKETHRQDHLKSQSESRRVEKEIGDAISTFLGLITKFEIITNKTANLTIEINKINELETRPAKEYESSQNYDYIRKTSVIEDEKELKKDYYKNLEPFDLIITKLKGVLK